MLSVYFVSQRMFALFWQPSVDGSNLFEHIEKGIKYAVMQTLG